MFRVVNCVHLKVTQCFVWLTVSQQSWGEMKAAPGGICDFQARILVSRGCEAWELPGKRGPRRRAPPTVRPPQAGAVVGGNPGSGLLDSFSVVTK